MYRLFVVIATGDSPADLAFASVCNLRDVDCFNLSFCHLPVSLRFYSVLRTKYSRHPSSLAQEGHLAMDAKMTTVTDSQAAVAASTGAEDANLADADDMELLGESAGIRREREREREADME